MRDETLGLLRCPETGSRLACADLAIVSELNKSVEAGQLQNRAGRPVEKRLDGGLVRAEGDVLYPIFDQIPVLLRDEAIPLT